MNKITLATDFSEASKNASNFAASLAYQMKAKLTLFHAFFIPPPPPHNPNYQIDVTEDLSSSRKLLASEKLRLSDQYKIEVDTIFSTKPLIQELSDIVKKDKIDLVVLGIRGADAFSKRLLGSTALAILSSLAFPVLVIPEMVVYTGIKTILLAYEASAVTKRNRLPALRLLAKGLGANISIVQVKDNDVQDRAADNKIKRMLKKVQFSMVNIQHKCTYTGLLKGIELQKPDLLVTVPGFRNTWVGEGLQSNTRKLLLRTNIPLLALPGC